MFLVKSGFPEEDELVLCTVTAIHYHSVFVKLDEYNKQGMIHISEISPGRIRNIRDYVVEGKKVVCKVLKIDQTKGHIDLSLRRVNEAQRRAKNTEIKQEQLVENMIKFIAQKQKIKPEDLFNQIYKKLIPEHCSTIYEAFEEVVAGTLKLDSLLDKKVSKELTTLILQRIKPPKVTIKGKLSLSSYDAKGITLIKELFKKCSSVKGDLTVVYAGAGIYCVTVVASDYKEAEAILDKWIKIAQTFAEKNKITTTFERIE